MKCSVGYSKAIVELEKYDDPDKWLEIANDKRFEFFQTIIYMAKENSFT